MSENVSYIRSIFLFFIGNNHPTVYDGAFLSVGRTVTYHKRSVRLTYNHLGGSPATNCRVWPSSSYSGCDACHSRHSTRLPPRVSFLYQAYEAGIGRVASAMEALVSFSIEIERMIVYVKYRRYGTATIVE